MNSHLNNATNAAITPQPLLLATNWKYIGKKTLIGTCDITTPSGFVFRGAMLHEKNDSRWCMLPSREYQKPDGARAFLALVEFTSAERRVAFSAACLTAIDVLLRQIAEDELLARESGAA